MKITPVLIVKEIEESLPFWIDRMGFTKLVEMPENDRIGFVILAREGVELMLQTPESTRKDTPQFALECGKNNGLLFIEVDDFQDTVKRLDGYPITLPERKTFYGMQEIGVVEPGGHSVVFAARI
jgi:catechol 2,3-dioxygenase-like lactoylglutathione lyase family enzyme